MTETVLIEDRMSEHACLMPAAGFQSAVPSDRGEDSE